MKLKSIEFKPLCLFFAILVLPTIIFGQEDQYLNELGVCASIVPNYVFVNGVKFEIDKQLENKPFWILFAGSYQGRSDDDIWRFEFDQMNTYGANLSFRYYVFSKDEPKGLYGQIGAAYNYTEVDYSGERWEIYEYNGNEAYRLFNTEGVDKIHQYGADLKTGYVVKAGRFVFFDFYVGLGIRESEVDGAELQNIDYGAEILTPAYSGVVPLIGVRLGVNF